MHNSRLRILVAGLLPKPRRRPLPQSPPIATGAAVAKRRPQVATTSPPPPLQQRRHPPAGRRPPAESGAADRRRNRRALEGGHQARQRLGVIERMFFGYTFTVFLHKVYTSKKDVYFK